MSERKMKAVGLRRYLPISDVEALLDVEVAVPKAWAYDLLVKVEAVSVLLPVFFSSAVTITAR